MSKQFNRIAKVIVTSKTKSIDVSALRILFEIEKNISNFANLGLVQIYNLSESSRNLIADEFQQIIIKVGYENESNLSVLYNAEIRNVFHRRVEENIITEIYCAGGDSYLKRSITKRGTGAAKSLGQIIRELVGDLKDVNGDGVVVGEINVELDFVQIKGVTYCDTTAATLNSLSSSYNFNWFIENRKFYALSANRILENQKTSIISPQYGMVSAPVLTEVGVDVKTLLNPDIAPGRRIKIESAGTRVQLGTLYFDNVNPTQGVGEYKVLRVVHTGDTRGNEWYTDIDSLANWGSVE